MEDFVFEMAKFVIPALIVFAAGFISIKKFLDFEHQKLLLEMRKEMKNASVPLKLQAFERITLFLERISPNSLVMRMNRPGMTAKQFHTTLIEAIRNEYEHNLSQQLYVSNATWDAVKKSKEEITRVVNVGFTKMNNKSTSLDLSKMIFRIIEEIGHTPTDKALAQLKSELRKTF